MHGSEDNGPRGGRRGGGGGAGGGRPGESARRRHQSEQAADPAPARDDEPLYAFTREEAREVDRLCTAEFGIPSILLMENAALGIASVARDLLNQRPHPPGPPPPPRILIFCGPGNNGGDGLATARHLANDGSPVAVILAATPEKYSGDAKINLDIASRMGIPIVCADQPNSSSGAAIEEARARCCQGGGGGGPDLVIDALLGTGLDRPPRGVMADLIGRINAFAAEGVPVLAVDVPSGMDADTGEAFATPASPGPVVRASVTVALLGLKPGYLTLAAPEFLGDCLVASIGAPRALIERLGHPVRPAAESGDAGAS